MPSSDDSPEIVTVAGTGAATDADATDGVEVTMLAGATGARLPTGIHRRSGAMPSPDAPTTPPRTFVYVAAMGGAVLALAVVALLVALG